MSTVYSDAFASLGAGWTQQVASWTASGTLTNASTDNNHSIITTNSTAHTALADQIVSITQASTSAFDGGPVCRFVDLSNFYYLDYTQGTDGSFTIYRRDNVTGPEEVQIASSTVTGATGKVIKLSCTGTGATVTFSAWYDGTLKIDAATDESANRITSAGYAGVMSWHVNDVFDDFLLEDTGVAAATGTGTFSAQAPSIAGSGIIIAPPAYGYATPDAGELATSWATWKMGDGAAVGVSGDANYGDLVAPTGTPAYGPVVDAGDANNKTFTVTCPKYGTNAGGVTVEYRGSADLFTWNAGTPSWTTYTAPVTDQWRYFQVRCTGS